jgi:hypothetical protein
MSDCNAGCTWEHPAEEPNRQTIDALFVVMELLDDVKDWCLLRIEELDS